MITQRILVVKEVGHFKSLLKQIITRLRNQNVFKIIFQKFHMYVTPQKTRSLKRDHPSGLEYKIYENALLIKL